MNITESNRRPMQSSPVPSSPMLFSCVRTVSRRARSGWSTWIRVASLALITTSAGHSQNGWANLGQGLPGSQGLPRLEASDPLVGNTLSVRLRSARASSNAWLIVGSRSLYLPFLGSILVPYPDLVLPGTTSRQGEVNWSFRLPQDAALLNQGLLLQALVLDATASQMVAFSDAVRATIRGSVNGHSVRTVSIGRTWDLSSIDFERLVTVPAADDQGIIVGMGIAGSNDHVYTWYADGTVSSGFSRNLEFHSGKQNFSLPAGYDPWDIVAMAIAGSNDHVYTWFADGKVSEGWSQDLGFYNPPTDFTLPPGKEISDIVGIGIAGSNDHVYAWYADGTVSEGWSQDLDFHRAPYAYELPGARKTGHIIDIGIAGSSDFVYAWFHDVERGSAHSSIADDVDARVMDVLRRYRLPGIGVAVSKNGRVVLEKGYGFRNFTTGARMQPSSRGRIGSVSKIITALSAMHLHWTNPGFSVSDSVYAPGGVLATATYRSALSEGVTRHQPIVAKAIAANDRVYTWNHDWTVSSGTSLDPDFHSGPNAYTLAPGMTPEDVRAIAIAPDSRVFVFYEDATFSAGRSWDLDRIIERDPNVKVSLPGGYSMSHVVGVAIAPSGRLYAWYDDGMTSAGTTQDWDADILPRSFSVGSGKSRYDIRGMGIAKSNSHVYTWLNDGTLLRGWSRDLDDYGGPTPYTVPGYAFDPSKDWNGFYDAIQVDHLLSHSSGLTRSGDVDAASAMFGLPTGSLSYGQVHRYSLRTRKLLFAPGQGESYSNHGMGTVGHIVSRISGSSYHDYARNHIIDPLGLRIRADSRIGQQSEDMYRHSYDQGVPAAYVQTLQHELGMAAGGWMASAGDLVRLMLATDRNANHGDILPGHILDLMESKPHPGASSFAHGWDSVGGGKLSHNGRLGGGTTYIAKYPRNYIRGNSDPITVAITTNIEISNARGGSAPLRKLAGDIAVAVNRAAIGLGYDLH